MSPKVPDPSQRPGYSPTLHLNSPWCLIAVWWSCNHKANRLMHRRAPLRSQGPWVWVPFSLPGLSLSTASFPSFPWAKLLGRSVLCSTQCCLIQLKITETSYCLIVLYRKTIQIIKGLIYVLSSTCHHRCCRTDHRGVPCRVAKNTREEGRKEKRFCGI